MGTDELIQQLIGLIRKESAVINLYDLVLDAVVDFELKDKLFLFQNDHKRHLEIILDLLNNIDVNNVDRMDLMISNGKDEEFRSQSQALGELAVKEKELNRLYKDILEEDVDSKSAEILDDNLEDEQQHIRFLEQFS
ncbi:MAG: ferritin-like domain-containing protein [Fibrobacter sp.]|jgi:rubrerythrin|nr:ferritin-like domain-containing protein [Fibrobacter sp.]